MGWRVCICNKIVNDFFDVLLFYYFIKEEYWLCIVDFCNKLFLC